jgi:hypothetical protein
MLLFQMALHSWKLKHPKSYTRVTLAGMCVRAFNWLLLLSSLLLLWLAMWFVTGHDAASPLLRRLQMMLCDLRCPFTKIMNYAWVGGWFIH